MSGAGAEELLVASDQVKTPDQLVRGRPLPAVLSVDPQTSVDLWVLPMEGDRTPWVFLKTPFREGVACSRRTAGGWRTSRTNRGGTRSTCGRLPARRHGNGRRGSAAVAGVHGGRHLSAWRPDGKELYYLIRPAR